MNDNETDTKMISSDPMSFFTYPIRFLTSSTDSGLPKGLSEKIQRQKEGMLFICLTLAADWLLYFRIATSFQKW